MAITIERTPNPNSLKFVTEQTVSTTTQWFASAADAQRSPLAADLFGLEGVANVMLLNNFVTIGKTPGADWDDLSETIVGIIEKHLS